MYGRANHIPQSARARARISWRVLRIDEDRGRIFHYARRRYRLSSGTRHLEAIKLTVAGAARDVYTETVSPFGAASPSPPNVAPINPFDRKSGARGGGTKGRGARCIVRDGDGTRNVAFAVSARPEAIYRF